MRTDATPRSGRLTRCAGLWLLPFLVAFPLTGTGCAFLQNVTEEEAPQQEVVIQTAEYGVITQVGPASMKDKEIHVGDIAITVDTEDGRVVVVIQREDDIYRVGDRVRILRDGRGFVRVQLI